MKKLAALILPGILMLTSFGPNATVDSFSYDVSLDGRPIGTYLVSRTDIDGASTFRVENNSAAGLIRKAEHRSVLLSLFDENKLVSSELKTWVNEKLESSSELKWNGNQYVKNDGDRVEEIGQQMVTYSSACVFFEEPVERTTLFYERYGKELEVEKVGDHKYEVKLPNGSKEQYTYHNGEVVMVEIVQTFATISLIKNS
ncbi:MAG: hypothetical protein RL266_1958 [Bacteroidota bacterium]